MLARNSAAVEKPSFAFWLRTGKRGRAKRNVRPSVIRQLADQNSVFGFSLKKVPSTGSGQVGFRSAFGAQKAK